MRSLHPWTCGIATALFGIVIATTWAAPDRIELDAAIDVPTGLTVRFATTADVTGDGRPDIVLSGYPDGSAATESVWIVPADGFGGFEAAYRAAPRSGGTSRYLYAFDADGDGDTDVLMPSDDLDLFLNDGTGSFTVVPLGEGVASFAYVEIADVNEDGIEDVVATTNLGTPRELHVFLSRGDGTFASLAPLSLDDGDEWFLPVVGDFDGDGHLDIAALAALAQRPSLLLFGGGDGTFTIESAPPALDAAAPWYRAADIDADGRDDLVDGRQVLFGRADRAFDLVANATDDVQGSIVEIVDVDGDTHLDLVTAGRIHCGAGDGTFADSILLPAVGSGGPQAAASARADITGDGQIDVVVLGGSASGLSVLPQKGLPPPTVLGQPNELIAAGRQTLRVTGTNFRPGVEVVALGDLVVHGVVLESETSLLIDVTVPSGIGPDSQALLVRNDDARTDRIDVRVVTLHARNNRGRIVDHRAPGRDKLRLKSDVVFTALAARGALTDPRDGLRLEIGDPASPFVIDIPAQDPRWAIRGKTAPARFSYRSQPGEFPRLRVVIDTLRGKLRVKARDLDLPGEVGAEVAFRVAIAGEPAEDTETFREKSRRNGLRRVLRRR